MRTLIAGPWVTIITQVVEYGHKLYRHLLVCNLLKLQYLNMYHAMIYIYRYILLCNGSS